MRYLDLNTKQPQFWRGPNVLKRAKKSLEESCPEDYKEKKLIESAEALKSTIRDVVKILIGIFIKRNPCSYCCWIYVCLMTILYYEKNKKCNISRDLDYAL